MTMIAHVQYAKAHRERFRVTAVTFALTAMRENQGPLTSMNSI